MSSPISAVSATLKRIVRERAQGRCEYCQFPEFASFVRHEIDHVVPMQHRGGSETSNLALACVQCNRLKGPNLSSIDPKSGRAVRLFNPRTDRWREHFRAARGKIATVTAIGRATSSLLNFNDPE